VRPGVYLDNEGADFVLFSEHSVDAHLCVFEGISSREFQMQRFGPCWRVRIEGVKAGLRYAYRVCATSQAGDKPTLRLLLDPYAIEVEGDYQGPESLQGACGLFGCVANPDDFDWQGDEPPAIPLEQTVLYEAHVRGATQTLDCDPSLRGTYGALASATFIEHVHSLGVTAIDLLPVHRHIDEDRLIAKNLTNYWGYNTVAFFAPETRYAKEPTKARDEFRFMVRALHKAGLEVILDVVYNHTAETDETGPTLNLRGIDNRTYYRVRHDNPALYDNFTGCGNTLNMASMASLDLVLDSLRYWVEKMHVDGFRFDLAATLTRDSHFLEAIGRDPVLSKVKLIAEPWDIGPDGYRLGRFPKPWSEWNDKFRDDVRAFWLTHGVGIGALAQRLCGSSEVFQYSARPPQASVNFVTAHDGFTLQDLVSYNCKHNERNGEDNHDGTDRNLSVNCGVEGPTEDKEVRRKRRKLKRALLATLFMSQGVPMLLAGDELSHSQEGNNNAYCQDNALTWLNWSGDWTTQSAYIGQLARIRRRFERLRSKSWFTGGIDETDRDVVWWHPQGREFRQEDWSWNAQSLGMLLGQTKACARLLVLFHRGEDTVRFGLPEGVWRRLLQSDLEQEGLEQDFSGAIALSGPCVCVLEERPSEARRQSGVLLHVTSLPGRYGSGDFGAASRTFVDWLAKANQSLWQVLPLTVTGEGNSPYMGASVFAGNELLIDPEALCASEWITTGELAEARLKETSRVDFVRTTAVRFSLLKRAAERFFSHRTPTAAYREFVEKNATWLEDYALFRALAEEQAPLGRTRWQAWPEALRCREVQALAAARERLISRIDFWKFSQWCFAQQYETLKHYANNRGIEIVGDMPIFVSPQSADVWAHQELFHLDAQGEPTQVAGVPPDYFSPTGQLWGNPLYDWDKHEKEGYAWWGQRFKRAATLYDIVRIDHFRGFEAYWTIPAGSANALAGHWEKGPGAKPFGCVSQVCPQLRFIAEDLGTITKEVDALRRELGFPGMRVFQFAFSGQPDNPHLPSNVSENIAYYPGTHDNDTVEGWFDTLSQQAGTLVSSLLGSRIDVHWAVMEAVFSSRARYAVVMLQDLLGLGSDHRMNRPGDATGCWGWRMRQGSLTEELALRLAALTAQSGRNKS